MIHQFRLFLAAGTTALLLSGCASSQLTVQDADLLERPAPSQVFVAQFAFSANDVSPDQSIIKRMNNQLNNVPPQTAEEQAGLSVARVMQKTLIKNLNNEGITATATLDNIVPPVGSLIIEGELLTVKEGNSFQRMAVGLGAGQSQVISYVTAYYISPTGPINLVKFYSNSKSSVKPGVASMLVVPAAAGGSLATTAVVGGTVDTLTARRQTAEADAARTAKQIAKKMDQVFETEGWIIPN